MGMLYHHVYTSLCCIEMTDQTSSTIRLPVVSYRGLPYYPPMHVDATALSSWLYNQRPDVFTYDVRDKGKLPVGSAVVAWTLEQLPWFVLWTLYMCARQPRRYFGSCGMWSSNEVQRLYNRLQHYAEVRVASFEHTPTCILFSLKTITEHLANGIAIQAPHHVGLSTLHRMMCVIQDVPVPDASTLLFALRHTRVLCHLFDAESTQWWPLTRQSVVKIRILDRSHDTFHELSEDDEYELDGFAVCIVVSYIPQSGDVCDVSMAIVDATGQFCIRVDRHVLVLAAKTSTTHIKLQSLTAEMVIHALHSVPLPPGVAGVYQRLQEIVCTHPRLSHSVLSYITRLLHALLREDRDLIARVRHCL